MKRLLRVLPRRALLMFILVILIFTVASGAVLQVFTLPSGAQLSVFRGSSQSESVHCYTNEKAKPIDNKGTLNILVWNIYKQNNDDWDKSLLEFTQNAQLALLQEVSMTDEFKAHIRTKNWFGSHVDAFKSFDISSGVLNLSTQAPLLACAHVELEPWLRLPKSGIYARYNLSNNKVLAVVNLHSVNFAYGNEEYTRQMSALVNELSTHSGPIIFAGDFNTWNPSRVVDMQSTLSKLGLVEIKFSPDNRTQFVNGMPLDHVFYKGLTVVKARSPVTQASDHNPLLVSFTL